MRKVTPRTYPAEYTCSECGKRIYLMSLSTYQYKLKSSYGDLKYQCSYTCYDHATLRLGKRESGVTNKKMWEYVKKCESSMKAQGKTILHPITQLKGSKK